MPLPAPDIESTPTIVPNQCRVHFTKSNLTATWRATDNLSLLQFTEKQGIKPDYGCRSGMCGTCETRLVKGRTEGGIGDSDGRVSLTEKDEKGNAKTENWILICCSVPTTEEVWLEK
jgi:ferredoxin